LLHPEQIWLEIITPEDARNRDPHLEKASFPSVSLQTEQARACAVDEPSFLPLSHSRFEEFVACSMFEISDTRMGFKEAA
jgi:hypothetical protein